MTIAWTQTTLLDDDLAKAEPATLRYCLLHVAARIAHGQRRLFVRIDKTWHWHEQLAMTFARLDTLPAPTDPPGRPTQITHNRLRRRRSLGRPGDSVRSGLAPAWRVSRPRHGCPA